METTMPTTPTAKQMIMICFTVSVMFVSITSFAQDKWLGYYESPADKILLQVEPKDKDGYFRGRLLYQDVIIPMKAFTLLGVMTGEYQRDGADKIFSLFRAGEVWTFTIDNQDYALKKVPKAEFPTEAEVAVQPTKSRLPPPQQATTSNVATSIVPTADNFSNVIKDPGGSYTVNFPEGWKVSMEDDVHLLTKSGEAAEFRIMAHHHSNRQELLNERMEEQREDNFNYLIPTVQPYRAQDVKYTFQGKLKGQPVVMEALLLMSPHGGGVALNATVTDKARAAEYFNMLEQMANTVVYSKPVEDNTWVNRVRGKQLLYLKTISGGSTKYYYNLYSNGRYDYVYSYVYNSSNFSGSENDRDEGTWKILNRGNKAVLVLNGNKKGAQEIVLEQRAGSTEIYGNGERFFIKTIE